MRYRVSSTYIMRWEEVNDLNYKVIPNYGFLLMHE